MNTMARIVKPVMNKRDGGWDHHDWDHHDWDRGSRRWRSRRWRSHGWDW
jgi:hypothetical protein